MAQHDDNVVTITTTTTTTTTTGGRAPSTPGTETARTLGGGRRNAVGDLIITPEDPNYPPYTLIFRGNGLPVQASGPHTDLLSIGDPNATISLQVTHNQTADGPSLTIQITRV
jgi:hypothetical protein